MLRSLISVSLLHFMYLPYQVDPFVGKIYDNDKSFQGNYLVVCFGWGFGIQAGANLICCDSQKIIHLGKNQIRHSQTN